jgi:hypothetical protein
MHVIHTDFAGSWENYLRQQGVIHPLKYKAFHCRTLKLILSSYSPRRLSEFGESEINKKLSIYIGCYT